MESPDEFRRFRARPVPKADAADHLRLRRRFAKHPKPTRGAGFSRGCRRRQTPLPNQPVASDPHDGVPSVEAGGHPAAGQRLEAFRGIKPRPLVPGMGDERSAQGMFGSLFRRSRELQQGLGAPPRGGRQRDHHGFAGSDRSGLVESHRADPSQRLERSPGPEHDAAPRTSPGRDEHRDGGRQPDRAGAGHHQHRHPAGESEADGAARKEPASDGDRRDHDDDRDEDARHPVGGPLQRNLLGLRFPHRRCDPRESAFGSGARHFDLDGAGEVHGARDHRIGRRPLHRDALAGHQGLVHRGAALDNATVERHAFPGAHPHSFPHFHARHPHHRLGALAHHPRLVGSKGEQLSERVGGPLPGPILQPASEADNRDDDRSGIEEQGAGGGGQQRHHRRHVGGPGAQSDQAVHSERPVPE